MRNAETPIWADLKVLYIRGKNNEIIKLTHYPIRIYGISLRFISQITTVIFVFTSFDIYLMCF